MPDNKESPKAETKPIEQKPEPTQTKADEVKEKVAAEPKKKDDKKSDALAAEQPSPTQAELDAIREGSR